MSDMHNEIDAVGWAILQALHEGVEDGPQSWSDLSGDQEKRIKKAAIAAIEAVTDLAQFKTQGFSWPPIPDPVGSAVTVIQRIKRIRCWWRYAHRESPTIGWFRYDVSGICCDCGKVGDGINHNDD